MCQWRFRIFFEWHVLPTLSTGNNSFQCTTVRGIGTTSMRQQSKAKKELNKNVRWWIRDSTRRGLTHSRVSRIDYYCSSLIVALRREAGPRSAYCCTCRARPYLVQYYYTHSTAVVSRFHFSSTWQQFGTQSRVSRLRSLIVSCLLHTHSTFIFRKK